ncbi:MAG TPA: hypothetical protein VJU53_15300 [Burkholderiaceae bacterium]|nr:hypothetical protein [Burkholderiaceae bacterium]
MFIDEEPASRQSRFALAELDGVRMADGAARIPLVEDGAGHRVRVVLA